MENAPKCYGAYGKKGCADCRKCEYRESCNYYTHAKGDLPLLTDRFVPLDVVMQRDEEQTDDGDLSLSRAEVAAFVRHMMNLDEYTLGVIGEVAGGKVRSVHDLADRGGVSRQVMARKVADLMALNPELTLLFLPLMPKLSAGRQRFLRHLPKIRKAKRK